ncbi:MAG: hypothetical protein WBP03_03045 [Candidatus Saccharimonadales bacterium]
MPKPKRLLLAIFASSLGRNDSGCFALVHEFQPWVLGPRVLAVGRRLSGFRLRYPRLALVLVLLALPLFSLTRAYVGAPRAYALPSDNLNFQARLETSTGSIAADGYYDIQFNLYSASTGGSSLWNETYSYNSGSGQCSGPLGTNDCRVRVANGYVSVYLGSITSFPSTIPWDQQLYLTMNVGGTTSSGPITWDGEMNPRLKLTAVPYAMAAKNAEQLTKSSGANISTLSIAAPTGGNQSFVLQDQGAAGTYNILTALTGTDGYVKLQATTPGSQQTGNLNISGVGLFGGLLQGGTLKAGSTQQFQVDGSGNVVTSGSVQAASIQTTSLDTATAAVLSIGITNASSITIGKVGTTTTIAGSISITPQTSTSTTLLCTNSGVISTCDSSVLAPTATNFIKNGSSQQASANFNIDGTGTAATLSATTTVQTPTIRAAIDGTTGIQFQNAAGTNSILSVDTVNSSITTKAGSDSSALGPELAGADFASGWTTTNWTLGGANTTATHIAGNTNALTNTAISITAGDRYQLSFTLSGSCGTGLQWLTVQLGGSGIAGRNGMSNVIPNSVCSGTFESGVTATTTGSLTFIPTSGWTGTISAISVKKITTSIFPAMTFQNSSGAANIEIRASNITSNTLIGLNAGSYNTTGSNLTAVGADALQNNTTGYQNSAIGNRALTANTSGYGNTANGYNALTANITGYGNSAVGAFTLSANTAGIYNTGFGYYAATGVTGSNNTALGSYALGSGTSATGNTAVGSASLYGVSTGSNNTGLGIQSLRSVTTGSNNTAIGNFAGFVDQTNNSFATLSSIQNSTAIGAYAQVQANNSIVLGSVDLATKVAIGITVPSNTLSVSPLDYQTGTASRTNGSAVLVGTGTTWTAAMVGDIIVFADGTTNTVTGFTSATSITMGTTYAGTTDASPVNYRFHKIGLQVTSTGRVGVNTTAPNAAYQMDVNGAFNATTLYQNGTAISSGFIQNQNTAAQTTSVFWVSGNGRSDTNFLAPSFDTATGVALSIGTTNATSITIGKSAIGTVLGSSTVTVGTSGTATTLQGAAQTTSNTNGNNLTIKASAGNGTGNGGMLVLSGGDAGASGKMGLVSLNPTVFASQTAQTLGTSQTLNQTWIDSYSTLPLISSATGLTFTVPAPSITGATAIGRVYYLTNAGATNDFAILLNGTNITINLKPNSTATLIWNGNGWTAAGASSATDLQAAYNNTLTSAGGAELVLNAPGGNADGLTIRNNGTPITGALFEVQSSIATNLFSVNNNTTEYAVNGGVENTTFTGWSAISSTVTQNTTAAYVASGRNSVSVAVTATTQGVKDSLSTSLPAGNYVVSFGAKLASGSSNLFNIYYSADGTAQTANCIASLPGSGYSNSPDFSVTTAWSKVSCIVQVPAGSTASNAILIKSKDLASGTFYVDNLSVISNDTATTPANVQIGGGASGGQPTLFTLDQFAGPPMGAGNSSYLGSMYYDTTKGTIQCYQSTGWGACGNAPDDIITLTPEYTNAVLNGTGVGTMTADFCGNGGGLSVNTGFCASGEARNYYKWTSPQATYQSYSIYVAYKLPSTFKGFSSGTTKLTALVDNTTNAAVKYGIYRKASGGGLTSCSPEATVVGWNGSSANGTASTWTDGVAGTTMSGTATIDPSACTSFVAGDTVIVKVTVTAQSNASAYVENLTFRYTNK